MLVATAAAPTSIAFPSTQVGFVSRADGALLATFDGGRRFRVVFRGPAYGSMSFVSSTAGFALVGPELRSTRDGGRSWTPLHRFGDRVRWDGPGGAAVSFTDAAHGWVGFPDGRVYRSVDGGRSWRVVRLRCSMYLAAVAFATVRVGFAVCAGQPATIEQERVYWLTRDGGMTWRVLRRGIFDGYVDGLIAVAPSLLLEWADRIGVDVAPGGRPLLFTDDGPPVTAMSWPDARHGFALVWSRGLLRTDDGGRSWRPILRIR